MRNATLRKIFILAAIASLVPALPASANSVAATAASAIEGAFGLEVTHVGDLAQAYVQDNSPADETTYTASFMVNINNLAMAPGTAHTVFRLSQSGGANNRLIRLVLKKPPTPGFTDYIVFGFVADNAGAWSYLGATVVKPAKNTLIRVDWQAATGPGANDGIARLYKGAAVKGESLTLNTDTKWVSIARLGAPAVPDATTLGSMYFDSFFSARTF